MNFKKAHEKNKSIAKVNVIDNSQYNFDEKEN
jgi:hypothetical protein